jgi:hypothetical protein
MNETFLTILVYNYLSTLLDNKIPVYMSVQKNIKFFGINKGNNMELKELSTSKIKKSTKQDLPII